MPSHLFLATLAFAFAPVALSYCVDIGASGQTGFGVFNSLRVDVDGALICTTGALEGGSGKVPCGDGGSLGGTLEYDWGTIAGPWDATYCDEKGRWYVISE